MKQSQNKSATKQDANIIAARLLNASQESSFWSFVFQHIRVKGEGGSLSSFSFNQHEYLRTIYNDDHPDIRFLKAAQMGLSTFAISKAMYFACERGLKVFYGFDTQSKMKDMVQDRVDPLIKHTPYFKRISRVDNVSVKKIGQGAIFFRGLETEGDVLSIDADLVILDELDRMRRQEHVEMALDRILASHIGHVLRLSQPSTPDYGIHAAYLETDQRFWLIKCACGRWIDLVNEFAEVEKGEIPSWLKKISGEYKRVCPSCSRDINLQKGQWVAKYPSVTERRGYQISQFYSELMDGNQLAHLITTSLSPSKRRRLLISIAGLPYGDKDLVPIDDSVLKNAERGEWWNQTMEPSYMGVDVGDVCHFVIGHWVRTRKEPVLVVHNFGTVNDLDNLEIYFRTHNIMLAVIDAMPYKSSVRRLADRLKGRVWMQYFTGGFEKDAEKEHDGKIYQEVFVERDATIDDTVYALRSGEIVLPDSRKLGIVEQKEMLNLHKQLKLLQKTRDEKTGELHYRKNVENHYGMALNSLRIAATQGKTQWVMPEHEFVSEGFRKKSLKEAGLDIEIYDDLDNLFEEEIDFGLY